MQGFWRYPLLPIGLVLVVLGLGNWAVSRTKLIEYAQRTAAPPAVPAQHSMEGFQRLTERSSTVVLESLHRGLGPYGADHAKRDFYAVVESGGRFIAISGLLFMSAGILQRWRERQDANGGPARRLS
ncbi:MAG: hypothetical protein AB7V27_17755 [Candidatus Binatia bacterium]